MKIQEAVDVILSAANQADKEIAEKESRIASLQDCIVKVNKELAEAGVRRDKAVAEAEKAEAKLAGVKKALDAYKAAVNV